MTKSVGQIFAYILIAFANTTLTSATCPWLLTTSQKLPRTLGYSSVQLNNHYIDSHFFNGSQKMDANRCKRD